MAFHEHLVDHVFDSNWTVFIEIPTKKALSKIPDLLKIEAEDRDVVLKGFVSSRGVELLYNLEGITNHRDIQELIVSCKPLCHYR